MNSRSMQRLLYYFGVGGVSAAVYIIAATLLTQAGMAPWLAGCASYAVITPLAYLGQHRLTFASEAKHSTALPRYLVLQSIGFTLSWLLPLLFAGVVSAPIVFGSVALSVAALNFILMKVWAFSPTSSGQTK